MLQERAEAAEAQVEVLRPQVAKMESDYGKAQDAKHLDEVNKLKKAVEGLESSARQRKSELAMVPQALDRSDALVASERLTHEGEMFDAANAAKKTLAIKERMISNRDAKLEGVPGMETELRALRVRCSAAESAAEQTAASVPALEQQVAGLKQQVAERLVTIKRLNGRLGGRPQTLRSEEELEECLGSTAYHCMDTMTGRVADAIGVVGTGTEIAIGAIMEAIKGGGYLLAVWESVMVWELRMHWLAEVRDELSTTWSAQLSMDMRDKLVVSYDKMDEIRCMLSHHRVGKELRPRPWVINPHDDSRVYFPQPIRPRCGALGWTKLIKAAQARYGLTMSKEGRVAQRSFAATVALQYHRDKARGLLRPITVDDPVVAVLGADGTGVGKRGIMHVASSIAPSYREGMSVENEKNVNTVATAVTDDHWGGLNEVLCGGYYTGEGAGEDVLAPSTIAAELNALIANKCLPAGADSDEVPIKIRGCFDLVAARGIRGGRGRCACHTEAQTSERFDVPTIGAEATWAEALTQLNKVPLLLAKDMRDDSHTPPENHDYAKGPWKCKRKGCCVQFESDAAFRAAKRAYLSKKAIKSTEGKADMAARAKAFALLHPSEQGEFEPPLTDLDMIDIAIDPLHCLLLNLPKVLWKYCFGDRMTNEQRELVAEYAAPTPRTHPPTTRGKRSKTGSRRSGSLTLL